MSYQDHIDGFQNLLDIVGKPLSYEKEGETTEFLALTERVHNDAEEWDLDKDNSQTMMVRVFKSAFTQLPQKEEYFSDDEGGVYRIKSTRPNPSHPAIIYICEYFLG